MRPVRNLCILLLVCLGFSITACVDLKDADIPGYIQNAKAFVQDGSQIREGDIKDLWVFQYPEYQGTYQIPVKFPVLNRERNQFLIRGGVWANDNPTMKKIYPFWQFDTLTKDLKANETIDYNPVFKYFPAQELVIPFAEGFEGNIINFINTFSGKDTAFITRKEGGFQSQNCGYIKFDSTHRNFSVVNSGPAFELQQGKEIWAEVTYKGDVKFSLAIRDDFFNIPTLAPDKDTWKTVYFDLSDQLRASIGQTKFKLYLKTVTDGSDYELFIDNIRLIRFAP